MFGGHSIAPKTTSANAATGAIRRTLNTQSNLQYYSDKNTQVYRES